MSTVLEKKIYQGSLKNRYILNHTLSSKKTYHIELELEESLPYKPGDSVGIIPENDPALVDAILARSSDPSLTVQEKKTGEFVPFLDFLTKKANLSKVSPKARRWFQTAGVPADFVGYDILDYLKQTKALIHPQELTDLLLPQLPRYYSIASSPSSHPNELHLTVSYVESRFYRRTRPGVASLYLSSLIKKNEKISFFLHPSKEFTIPANPSDSMIMIGPGTGIAPFRSFLFERYHQKGTGKNWLFFGERNEAWDYYYQDLWEKWQKEKNLLVSTAFSRDQKEKIYVQNRLLENKQKVWKWIQEGSYLFVCGDAKKMAKEVHATLIDIAKMEGSMTKEEAKNFWQSKKKDKKYILDVY